MYVQVLNKIYMKTLLSITIPCEKCFHISVSNDTQQEVGSYSK